MDGLSGVIRQARQRQTLILLAFAFVAMCAALTQNVGGAAAVGAIVIGGAFLWPAFASITEFVNGRNGDCGPTATLICLHALNPARWPLTAAALDALVRDMQAHADANWNGVQNIYSTSSYLANVLGVPHTLVGYGQVNLDTLHTQLQALGGNAPRLVLPEWADAGAGLHDDERGVKFHFSAFGGYRPATANTPEVFLRGDGDSFTDARGASAGETTPAIPTTWDEIVGAQPCAYIVFDQAPSGQEGQGGMTPDDGRYFVATDATHWKCVKNGLTVQDGILLYYQSLGGVDACGIPVTAETYPRAGTAVQVFERATLVYDPQRLLDNPPGASGDCYRGKTEVYSPLQAALTAEKAQVGTLYQEVLDLRKQIASLQAQIEALQAQVAAQHATPEPTPPHEPTEPITPTYTVAQLGAMLVAAIYAEAKAGQQPPAL